MEMVRAFTADTGLDPRLDAPQDLVSPVLVEAPAGDGSLDSVGRRRH